MFSNDLAGLLQVDDGAPECELIEPESLAPVGQQHASDPAIVESHRMLIVHLHQHVDGGVRSQ